MSAMRAGLFDLDGVIFDTESQYTEFWNRQGDIICPDVPDFGKIIKGRTLKEIAAEYFPDPDKEEEIIRNINEFEREMSFEYIPGALAFIEALKHKGVKVAIVTSSNDAKMKNVYHIHPEITDLFDFIVTADKITRSKPDPECYLLAARELGMKPEECVVFEDSFSGLEAGRRAGMFVVGLATTNSADKIADKADCVTDDFLNRELVSLF